MNWIWIILAVILGFVCALTQFWTVRLLRPETASASQLRVIGGYVLRMVLIALYFWQLVQLGFVMILFGLFLFLGVYLGSVLYVADRKPHWLQSDKGRSEQWMQ